MGIYEEGEKWLWNVALKKIIAASIGFLASQKAVTGLAWLQTHGITITIDPAKFQTEFTLLGIASFAAIHDWLKLKFPNWKWL